MAGWEGIATADALRAFAPEATAALEHVRRCAQGLGTGERLSASPALLRYAEQFNADVASLTPAHRADAAAVPGEDLFGFVQGIWALDMAERADHALSQLASCDDPDTDRAEAEAAAVEASNMWAAVDTFLTAVARLQALDPVTTEVVRLRGARAHDCRLCRSLRSVSAIEAGAADETFDAIDRYEASDLDDRLKVALRLVDALIWQPRRWDDGLAASVRDTFTPAEAVEIVLDVVRNAANKIAVALEVDQANVTDGVEYFAVDADGTLTYGLERPSTS